MRRDSEHSLVFQGVWDKIEIQCAVWRRNSETRGKEVALRVALIHYLFSCP
jgi:hypothetical protein